MKVNDPNHYRIVEASLMPGSAESSEFTPAIHPRISLSTGIKSSDFFNLPTEIRDILYTLIIDNIQANDKGAKLPLPCTHVQEPLPFAGNTALLCVSQQFRNELLGRYYRENTVRIVLDMSKIYIANTKVVGMVLPIRPDWRLIRKLDITIIRDRHDNGMHCVYCGLRGRLAYQSEFQDRSCRRRFTSGLRHSIDSWPYVYPSFVCTQLETPQLRELAVRYASSDGYSDYKEFAGRIRTITAFLRGLGAIPVGRFSVSFYYGRGCRSPSAEMDYLQLKPRHVIEARNPSTHLLFDPVLPHLVPVQALLDQGCGYEEINYRLYGDRLREQGREHLAGMDRTVLPRNLDGWICPWTGRDVRVRAIEIWGVYRWWLKDDRAVPRW